MAVPATIEIGRSLNGLTSDPDWVKRYGLLGLLFFVPIVGPLVVVGWQRRVYERSRDGDDASLPPISFGDDLSHGIPVFGAMLNLMIPAMLVMMVGWVGFIAAAMVGSGIDQATDGSGAGGALMAVAMIVMYGLFFVVWVVTMAALPELQRRGFNGEATPLFHPGESFRAVRDNPGAYLMVLLGMLVANVISSLGAFACYVGLFFTLPMAMVVIARLVAQWDKVVEESQFGS